MDLQQLLRCFGISKVWKLLFFLTRSVLNQAISTIAYTSAKGSTLESERDFSVPEDPNVPTMGCSQINTTLRGLPTLGIRMAFRRHRDDVRPRVIRVWSFTYTAAEKRILIVDTVRAEIKRNGKEQTTMEILRFDDLIEMKGAREAVAKFWPELL